MKTTYLATAVAWLAAAAPALAFDVNENLSLGITLAAVGQCQNASAGDAPDTCRGAAPVQLEGAFRPAEGHELGFKLGFAGGNGLNTVSPFALAAWAADLEDDVRNINGRDRDYLLAAWYRFEAQLADDSKLGAAIGILDSTDYLDGNEYANDEYTQFMNEAFVNAGSHGLPSYDAGAAVQWEIGDWSASAVAINVGENDDGNNFNFVGAQLAYHVETDFGPGNYRLILAGTSDDFLEPTGTRKARRLAGGVSFDQAFGDVLGAFLRFAWQEEDALVDYKALYSGGLNFSGTAWGREADNIGVGLAYLPGGNGSVNNTKVFETYYRLGLTEELAVTADVQWMSDRYKRRRDGDDTEGWAVGLRLTASF